MNDMILEADRFSPSGLGFRMPAEWEPHARCWMAWPCHPEIWEGRIKDVRRGYAGVAHAIRQFEPVTMVVSPEDHENARTLLDPSIDILEIPLTDSWTRDTGPCFVINAQGDLGGVDFRFNAWGGNYEPHDKDALLARRILDHLGLPVFSSTLTCEGGAITVDGEGTLITTETCLLNPNRNPGWTRDEIDRELKRLLGVEKVIWLPGNEDEDETNGHVDGVGVFVRPGLVLMERSPDPDASFARIMAENVKAMEGQTDARGRPIELAFCDEAQSIPEDGDRFCRSYVNSYIANGGVVIPSYGISEDDWAFETFAKLFPDRKIVSVPVNDIAIGGGGIHCITQQEPLTRASKPTGQSS
ncbi:MAG: agmatine deiminase family protein [Pseudomonadota bacterium]